MEITDTSIAIDKLQISSSQKIALILGSENKGINEKLLNISDQITHLPMSGENSSLNVAVACAIAVFELRKLF